MNLNTKGKRNIIPDVYFNTSVADIWNYLAANSSVDVTRNVVVEVSQTGRNITLVVLDCDLSKKSILVGTSKIFMDL